MLERRVKWVRSEPNKLVAADQRAASNASNANVSRRVAGLLSLTHIEALIDSPARGIDSSGWLPLIYLALVLVGRRVS